MTADKKAGALDVVLLGPPKRAGCEHGHVGYCSACEITDLRAQLRTAEAERERLERAVDENASDTRREFLARVEAESALARETARAEALAVALRPFVNEAKPVNCPETKAVDGEWVEAPGPDWVCLGCGNYGEGADGIEHAADCNYVRGLAALATPTTAGGEGG